MSEINQKTQLLNDKSDSFYTIIDTPSQRQKDVSSISNKPLDNIADIENGYCKYQDEDDTFNYGMSKPTSRWKLMALYAVSLILATLVVMNVTYFTLTVEAKYVKVPDLIRVKKNHVLTSSNLEPVTMGSENNKYSGKFPSKDRIILVGDVHGNIKQLKELMAKITFNPRKDELVFLGDMISKGPSSFDVLDYAIQNNASCIRGNHEDAILYAYTKIHHLPKPKVESASNYKDEDQDEDTDRNIPTDDLEEDDEDIDDGTESYNKKLYSSIKNSDMKVARRLQPEHIKYLGSCPLIMDLGYISKEGTRVVGVHGGLHWNIKKLYKQPPADVLTMRSLLKPDFKKGVDTSKGRQWSKVWTEKQLVKPIKKRLSVFYGHDARHGLNLQGYSFGLDSNCIGGGQLTAMVVTKQNDGKFDHSLFSVDCS